MRRGNAVLLEGRFLPEGGEVLVADPTGLPILLGAFRPLGLGVLMVPF